MRDMVGCYAHFLTCRFDELSGSVTHKQLFSEVRVGNRCKLVRFATGHRATTREMQW